MPLFLEEYEKLRMLGKGAFASVYKVRHHDLGYVRAVKVSNEVIEDENDKSYQTFLNECRVLLKIGNGCHPNIVRIYQPRLIANKAIVEMDYVDGITLSKYLEDHPFIEYSEAARFAREIVGAMAYCHADLYKFLMDPQSDNLQPDPNDGSRYVISKEKERELIAKYCVNHNDLHSNNIMRRNYDSSFLLLDFGLAIQGEHCVKSSSRGDGAYEYCSPEKLEGKEITSASDVYSLGILLYEMLAGRVPFVMDVKTKGLEVARYEVYKKHLEESPPAIEPLRRETFERTHPGEQYVRDFPESLEFIINKCLAKNPADRYPDAKALLTALLPVIEARPAPTPGSSPCHSSSDIENQLRNRLSNMEEILKQTRVELSEAESRAMQSEKSLFTVRNSLAEAQSENKELRSQLLNRPASGTPTKNQSTMFWVASFFLLLISVGITATLFFTTEYWRESDALIDKIAIGAGVLSLASLLLVGIFRKAGLIFWALAGACLALTATLQFKTSFVQWNKTLGILTALAMLSYMAMWIISDRHNRGTDNKSRHAGPKPPSGSSDADEADDVEMAELA